MKKLLLFAAIALSIDVYGQSTVKIGNLEVMTKDLGYMNWGDAERACESLGDGWRLPTKDELNILFKGKDVIGGFKDGPYWSSTEGVAAGDLQSTWWQNFWTGRQYKLNFNRLERLYVRAVRAF